MDSRKPATKTAKTFARRAITLTAGDLPWSWPQYATTFFLDHPTNQIGGPRRVYALPRIWEERRWEESDGTARQGQIKTMAATL